MKFYNETFENFSNNYIGCATMAVIGQSCLGAVAAMCVLSNGTSMVQMVQLSIIVFANMFANTSILAQMTLRLPFGSRLKKGDIAS
jgi:DNA-binding transcriptional regulator of glucitol operon